MPNRTEQDFPLFPLSVVALPSEIVPLHIFEDRYKQMIDECIEKKHPFGIVWLSDQRLQDVGCSCEIADEVTHDDDSGERDIITRGVDPFRVISKSGDLAYPAGEIEFLLDESEEIDDELLALAHQEYVELVEQVTEKTVEDDSLGEMRAYEMAATIDFSNDAKQGLLELRSENARLDLLVRLLRGAIKHLELADLAQARARSNGKIRLR